VSEQPGTDASPGYDPASYWERRLRHNFSLAGVGFQALGKPFNNALYRQRLTVLGRTLRRYRVPIEGADIVELGPGTGFYVSEWQRRGARSVVGLDITAVSRDELRSRFPAYRFEQADVTETWPLADGSADVVAAFDVLFHVVDDARLATALAECARALRPGGALLISDLFLHGSAVEGFHQVVRPLDQFARLLAAAGFDIVGRVPVFVTMQPALDLPPGRRRALAGRWWAWLEARLREQPKRGYRLGQVLSWVDRALTYPFHGGPSIEILVARKQA
jgi:SAM-dependent methyltransferase